VNLLDLSIPSTGGSCAYSIDRYEMVRRRRRSAGARCEQRYVVRFVLLVTFEWRADVFEIYLQANARIKERYRNDPAFRERVFSL
jgi:hypothetical protein